MILNWVDGDTDTRITMFCIYFFIGVYEMLKPFTWCSQENYRATFQITKLANVLSWGAGQSQNLRCCKSLLYNKVRESNLKKKNFFKQLSG